jgi:hypothetical protein
MLPHNYNWAKNSVQLWDTSDSEQRYLSNLAKLQELNFDTAPITYKFNSHGFRSAEFESIDILSLGCSFTLGCGVAEQHTWPAQLAKMSGLNVANLGHSGASNDTAFRFAKHYIALLKPKFLCWLQTDRHRLEIIDDSQRIVTNLMANDDSNTFYGNDNFIKQWFASASNQDLNQDKNTLAVRQLCNSAGIHFAVIGRDEIETLDLARDLMHPGKQSYKRIAERFARQLGVI